jgi:hypothetical protein
LFFLDVNQLVVAAIRAGRLISKNTLLKAGGKVLDQETYELESTRIVRRGVLCFRIVVLQTLTISTITTKPSGKVRWGPTPELIKESVISEEQVACPEDDEINE